MSRVRLVTQSHWAKLGLVLGVMVAQVVAFMLLPPSLRGFVLLLSPLLVAVAGRLYGVRGGLLMAGLSLPSLLVPLSLTGLAEVEGVNLPGLIIGTGMLLLTGVVVGRLHDLGERVKQVLSERLRAEQALRENEQRYRAISELTSDYVYGAQVRPNGRVVTEWIAGAFIEITGYTTEEVIDAGAWLSFLHPDDRSAGKEFRKTHLEPI